MNENDRIEFLVNIYNIEMLVSEMWEYLDEIERQRSLRNHKI